MPEAGGYEEPVGEIPGEEKLGIGETEPERIHGGKDSVVVRFRVPKGKVAGIMGVMNLLQSKFETLEVTLAAKGGTISNQDYDEKIEEAFTQLGIRLEDD